MSNATPDDIKKELTGILNGTLDEDFMVTARAVGAPYCRVSIPDLGWVSGAYPLTYVPFQALGYALRAGDHVQVKFSQDDIRFPYLWKHDQAGVESVAFPVPQDNSPKTSGAVAFPSTTPDEYTFQILSGKMIAASNGVYDCIRRGDSVVYFMDGGVTVYAKTGAIGLRTNGGYINISQAGTVDVNGHLTVTP